MNFSKYISSLLVLIVLVVLSIMPAQARFLQTDPIGYADQMNLYAYTHNDPLNYTDPSGRDSCRDCRHGPGNTLRGPGPMGLKPGSPPSLDNIQTGLDAAGFAGPVGPFADAANTAISVARGNLGDAAVNAIAIVPVAGDAVKGTKMAAEGASSAMQANKLSKQLGSEQQMSQLANGEGTVLSHPAKTADSVAQRAGGNPQDIQKVSSGSHTAPDGTTFETHAFRNDATGEIIEPKTKITNDGNN